MPQQTPEDAKNAMLLQKLIAPEIADSFLRLLWQDLTKQPQLTQTHQQDLLRKNAVEIHGRNYPPLLAMHWGLTPIIAERTGADILPSFSFFRLYFEGDICRVHSDRAACEVSLSLTLGYSEGRPWALSVSSAPAQEMLAPSEDFGGEPHSAFVMQPGDAVLYCGSGYRHGRLTPNPNRWSAHLFLQWVRRGGPHEGEAFERLDLGGRPGT
jgi:hypothetical protein